MTTKRSGGNITGLLALTVEQQEECEPWTAVHLVGDYEVEKADGSRPILGLVSVGAYGRVGTGLGTSVGNPIVPGQITVEAPGFMVRRLTIDGDVDAGFEVGMSGTDLIQRPGGDAGTSSVNEVQTVTITGTPTGGTFTLTLDGDTTTAIAFNASAADVRAALEALDSVGVGNVKVTGSAGGPYSVTFRNDLAGQNVPTMTKTASLTGGTSPDVAITTPTAGVADTWALLGLALMGGVDGDDIDVLVR